MLAGGYLKLKDHEQLFLNSTEQKYSWFFLGVEPDNEPEQDTKLILSSSDVIRTSGIRA